MYVDVCFDDGWVVVFGIVVVGVWFVWIGVCVGLCVYVVWVYGVFFLGCVW